MKRALLSLILVVAVPFGAAAQDASGPPSPIGLDVSALEGLCEANATDGLELSSCLYVVHQLLVPGTGAAGETPPWEAPDGDASAVASPDAGVAGVVPLKTWATVGDWDVRFTKVKEDGWPAIKKANMFNDAPSAGRQYFMAWLQYKYKGEGRAEFSPIFKFGVVGDSGVEFELLGAETCGVLPDGTDVAQEDPTLRKGGMAEGWLCWSVAKQDVDSLGAFLDDDTDFVEFALR